MLPLALSAAPTTPPTDIWGIVIPGYIGAIGGLVSAIVGAVALIQSIRAKGGIRSIAAGLNAEPRTKAEALPGEISSADAALPPEFERREFLTWSIRKGSGDQYLLVNRSHTVTATLTGIVEVNDGNDLTLDSYTPLPMKIAPQGHYVFYLTQTFTSPAVTALRIEWDEPGRGPQSQTLYQS